MLSDMSSETGEIDIPKRAPTRTRAVARVLLVLGSVGSVAAFVLWHAFQPSEPPGILESSGRIEGGITTLSPRSAGRVVSIQADEGQAVTSRATAAAQGVAKGYVGARWKAWGGPPGGYRSRYA